MLISLTIHYLNFYFKIMKNTLILFIVALTAVFFSCSSSDYIPKPKGFNHISLPPHEYSNFEDLRFPYQFDISKHAKIYDDTVGLMGEGWKIVEYNNLIADIYFTYEPIKSQKDGFDLINDSYKIAYKHDVKAYAIDRRLIETKNGYPVVIFEIKGEVPSPYQFFMHNKDTTQYFRGAVYFPTSTKNDSLAPVIDYVVEDMNHLLESFQWKE